MKVTIRDGIRDYEIQLNPITQICGTNFECKNFIRNSILYYFSTHKYLEHERRYQDNIKIDGEMVGRSFFQCVCIRNREDLLQQINLSKTSLSMKVLQSVMKKYEGVVAEERICQELITLYEWLNNQLHNSVDIFFSFAQSDLMSVVQKSVLTDSEEHNLEEKSDYELLEKLLDLLQDINEGNPERRLLWIEDVDHLISYQQYEKLVQRCQKISEDIQTSFVFTTSIRGFACVSKALLEGISVVNQNIFSFPESERLLDFLERNYPCNKVPDEQTVYGLLRDVVQEIGSPEEIWIRPLVLQKMINATVIETTTQRKDSLRFLLQPELNYLLQE